MPAMAYATQHLGFGVTCNLTYEPPYTFARRMSTLDHLTKGRIGWNVVTGYLDSAARGMGLARAAGARQPLRRGRGIHAGGLPAVGRKLGRRRRAARSRRGGIYADPARIHRVKHDGQHYKVDAIHLSEPSPQRTPVLYQAGASARGREFAAAHAECIFVNGQFRHNVREIVADIRARAKAFGRDPYDIKVFVGATVVVAPTDAEAQDKLAEYRDYASSEGALAHYSASVGVDFSRYGPDEPIRFVKHQRDALQPGGDHGAQPRHRMDAAQAAGDDGAGQPPGADRRLAVARGGRVAGLGGRGRRGRLQPVAHGGPGMRGGLRGPGGAGTADARRDEAGLCARHAARRNCSVGSARLPASHPAARCRW